MVWRPQIYGDLISSQRELGYVRSILFHFDHCVYLTYGEKLLHLAFRSTIYNFSKGE